MTFPLRKIITLKNYFRFFGIRGNAHWELYVFLMVRTIALCLLWNTARGSYPCTAAFIWISHLESGVKGYVSVNIVAPLASLTERNGGEANAVNYIACKSGPTSRRLLVHLSSALRPHHIPCGHWPTLHLGTMALNMWCIIQCLALQVPVVQVGCHVFIAADWNLPIRTCSASELRPWSGLLLVFFHVKGSAALAKAGSPHQTEASWWCEDGTCFPRHFILILHLCYHPKGQISTLLEWKDFIAFVQTLSSRSPALIFGITMNSARGSEVKMWVC